MEIPGIADTLTGETAAAPVPAVADRAGAQAAAAAARSLHRFDVDPASSPAMMAAFAWTSVAPGR